MVEFLHPLFLLSAKLPGVVAANAPKPDATGVGVSVSASPQPSSA